MPIARYTRMKKTVHCTLRDGAATYFGVGRTEQDALESARQSREQLQQQAIIPKPAPPIPGWHRLVMQPV